MEAVEPDEVGWSYSAPALPDGFIAIGHALASLLPMGSTAMVCLVIFIRAPLHGTHCSLRTELEPDRQPLALVFPIVKYAGPAGGESWKLAPAAAQTLRSDRYPVCANRHAH